MQPSLSEHLAHLVDKLAELRTRLKQAARFELAQAIGESLSQATQSLLCGHVRLATSRPDDYADWEDPWADPYDRRHGSEFDEDPPAEPQVWQERSPLAVALMTGFGAARWSFAHSGQPLPALLWAAAVAALVFFAGRYRAPLLEACTSAQELLAFTSRRR